jgi:hypothetical protein
VFKLEYAVMLLLIVWILIQKCTISNYEGMTVTLDSLTLANQKLDSIVNKQGRVIYSQKVLEASSQESINALTKDIFSLKNKDKKNMKVIAYYQGRTVTGIHDTLEVSWTDTTAMREFEDSVKDKCSELIEYIKSSTVIVPATARGVTPYYDISLTATKGGIFVDRVVFPDSLHVQFVEKGKFLQKKYTEVHFFHSNPYVKSTGSNSVIYKPQKKKRIVEKALLIGTGIFLGSKL